MAKVKLWNHTEGPVGATVRGSSYGVGPGKSIELSEKRAKLMQEKCPELSLEPVPPYVEGEIDRMRGLKKGELQEFTEALMRGHHPSLPPEEEEEEEEEEDSGTDSGD